MCYPTYSSATVLVAQPLFTDDPVQPAGCIRTVMLCICDECKNTTNPTTPAGRLHDYLENCFKQDIADAKAAGLKPPLSLVSRLDLDPRHGSRRPTKKLVSRLIATTGVQLHPDVKAAYT